MIGTEKLKWTDAFYKKDAMTWRDRCRVTGKEITRPATELEVVKNLASNLKECPDCGYVFDSFKYIKDHDTLIFVHSFARKKELCKAKYSEIRTGYHTKRAALLAEGRLK
jgi:hypothetical protein